MHRSHHILLVEDEASLADTIALNLKLENYQVTLVRTGNEALSFFKKSRKRRSCSARRDVARPERF